MPTNTKGKKQPPKKTAAPKRRTQKGVKEPLPNSIAGKLWKICDDLKKKLGRAPARFEYREVALNSKENFNHESVSYQFFQWRKFNGVKGHSTGRYPSRGSFEVSKRTKEREAAKSTPKKKPSARKAATKAKK